MDTLWRYLNNQFERPKKKNPFYTIIFFFMIIHIECVKVFAHKNITDQLQT